MERSAGDAMTQLTSHDAAPHTLAIDGHWWTPIVALAFYSFLLHFVWEMLQFPLYGGMATAAHWLGIRMCLRATVGDVAIALSAYIVVAAWTRTWYWRASRIRIAAYLTVGLATTVLFEVLNVYVWHRWAYAPAMPILLGVGVSPLLQWIIVPLLAFWLSRRCLPRIPAKVAMIST